MKKRMWIIPVVLLLAFGLSAAAIAAAAATGGPAPANTAHPNIGLIQEGDILANKQAPGSSQSQEVQKQFPASPPPFSDLFARARQDSQRQRSVQAVTANVSRLEFGLNEWGDTNVWGQALAGDTVTVATASGEYTFVADGSGNWNGNVPQVFPGERITATASSDSQPVVTHIPDPFEVQADSALEQVWGQVGGYTQIHVHGDWFDGDRDVNADTQGNFTATYTDIPRGGQGFIRVETTIGAPGDTTTLVFHRSFSTGDMMVNVNYAHEWVESNYESGHTLMLTLTNATGQVKATASGETSPIPWWGDQPGFSTNYNVPWDNQRPDLEVGDWVHVSLDDGQQIEIHIGEIDGAVDAVGDSVSGTVSVPWYTEMLNLNCSVWGGGVGPDEIQVDPQGGSFSCDFSADYDLLPGHEVGVQYREPDGDSVINVLHAPAPDLEIRLESFGQPASGNNFPLRVRYANRWDGEAEQVVITATFEGATYVGDTSGLTATPFPGGVAWDVGDLPPYSRPEFDVFVQVDVLPDETFTATTDIETESVYYQNDPSQKHAEWYGQAQENDTHLNVGMGDWTGAPAPGYEYVYAINVCNNGSTASDEVVLTATIPASTTLSYWWSQFPGWQEVSAADQQLTVTLASLNSYSCGEVYVRPLLSAAAWPGMELHASAGITATSDLEGDDNFTERWHNVGSPYTNLEVDKQWNWGILTPGGELHYNINYRNSGNVPIGTFYITDTLPVSTTFREAYGAGSVPYDVGDGYVVWQINGLDNGYSDGFEVVLDVAPDAIPGTELINRAEITRLPGEETYDDNQSEWRESLYPSGPNLRVIIYRGDWHGDYPGHAWYSVAIENIGDETVSDIAFTNAYPAPMQLDGGIDVEWWRLSDWQDHPASHTFTATFEYLEPGNTTWINFNTNFGANPVLEGLILTNTASVAAAPGETLLLDNSDDFILTTGPDLWLEKTLVGGKVLPGELITFSLAFGNNQPGHTGWWNLDGNAILTDTLPDELEFVTSLQQNCGPGGMWCVHEPEQVNGDQYTWNLWPIHVGEINEIWVVARVVEGLNGLDAFTNQAEIASDDPANDIDPLPANNFASLLLPVELPYFEIAKSYQGNIAGASVTYTLAVTNQGYGAGTGVEVADPLPSGLTYGGGGNLAGGILHWDIAQIDPQGDAENVEFWGTLSCQVGTAITNQGYAVVASDQGVTSTLGGPVTFNIQAPTIAASFLASADEALPGATIDFTSTSTTNGAPLTLAWDFGDEQTAAGATASHAFTEPGSYDVTLTATDGCSFHATYTLTVVVSYLKIYLPLLSR